MLKDKGFLGEQDPGRGKILSLETMELVKKIYHSDQQYKSFARYEGCGERWKKYL